ncbi:hypothetical protein SteCoe_23517 [Stentor coeruleus]|uniref:Uncharacterized protein n=1 Tax=Stentor coeruleus TaxID=5963 RepID=A0A1R2BJQ7_9CILI|nr:hypothetical protein SteCoe_23517 [Stentor coeruleus]
MEAPGNLSQSEKKLSKTLDPSKSSHKRQKSQKKIATGSSFSTSKSKKLEISVENTNQLNLSPLYNKGNYSDNEFIHSPTEDYFKSDTDNSMFDKYTQSPLLIKTSKLCQRISQPGKLKKLIGKRKNSKSKSSKIKEKRPSSPETSNLLPKSHRPQKSQHKILKPQGKKVPKKTPEVIKKPEPPTKQTIFQTYTQNSSQKKLIFSTSPKNKLPTSPVNLKINKNLFGNLTKTCNDFSNTLNLHNQSLQTINEKHKKKVTIVENSQSFEEPLENTIKISSSDKKKSLNMISKTFICKKSQNSTPESVHEGENNDWIKIENIKNDGKTSEFVKNFATKMLMTNKMFNSKNFGDLIWRRDPSQNKKADDGSEKNLKDPAFSIGNVIPKLNMGMLEEYEDCEGGIEDYAFVMDTSETLSQGLPNCG